MIKKGLLLILFCFPQWAYLQSLVSTSDDVIHVSPNTILYTNNGVALGGSLQNSISFSSSSLYLLNTGDDRVLMNNSNAIYEVRSVGFGETAEFHTDISYGLERAVAAMQLTNKSSIGDFSLRLTQVNHTEFNDIPIEWIISKTNTAANDVQDLVFRWDPNLEPSNLSFKALFVFNDDTNDWEKLPVENTIIDEVNHTLTYSEFIGDLSERKFMISQSLPQITLDGILESVLWCPNSASVAETFTVSAVDLVSDLIVNAPANFEISLTNTGSFSSSLVFTPDDGVVEEIIIYIRISETATSSGTFSIEASPVDLFYNRQAVNLSISSIPDTIAPLINVQNITVSVDSSCELPVINLGTDLISDNCELATVSNNAPVRFPLGTTTVLWTATDRAGNTTSATQEVLVLDTAVPIISNMPTNILQVNDFDSCNALVSWVAPNVIDNCTGFTLTSSHDSGSVFDVGTTMVTYTATDNSGNITTANFTVTVVDTQLPSIVSPADLVVNLNNSCVASNVELGVPVIADNCSVASLSNNAPNIFPLGETEVTWTVIDNAGNLTRAVQKVTVFDVQAPMVRVKNIDLELNVNGNNTITVFDVDDGSSDNCAIDSMELSKTSFDCSNLGRNTVLFTVTDVNGNTASESLEVTVLATNIVNSDNDELPNICDPDDDNDGVLDAYDAFPTDPSEDKDTDGDGIGDNADADIDGDGVVNSDDAFPTDPTENTDTDGNGIGDNSDTDIDGDGVGNTEDAFPLDPSEDTDTDGDGEGDNSDTDIDGDGVANLDDAFPLDGSEDTDTDGDGEGDNSDTDIDGDGVSNTDDAFPLDPAEDTDTDGDGIGDNTDTDIDGDGVSNAEDAFPLDPAEDTDTDGDGIGDNSDTDIDGDGVANTDDAFPTDPSEDKDTDGDGEGDNSDTDIDGDGVVNTDDAFPLDDTEDTDTDGDGEGDNSDTDIDGDGVGNTEDAFPLDPTEDTDTDGDGEGDNSDTDIDGDGIDNDSDSDVDGDGVLDNGTDVDGDGINDANDEPSVGQDIRSYNAVTPNGDGVHDEFRIENLTAYPNNRLQIVNRWGAVVYESQNYGTTGNYFVGEHYQTGEMLPGGVYYYTFQYTTPAGDTQYKQGYLYLGR